MKYALTTRNFWNPIREFSPWFRDMDEMMDRLLEPMTTLRREQAFNPAVDVEEADSHYLLSVDLPGVSKEDVKIEVLDGQLVISGERKAERKEEKQNRYLVERHYGSFQRMFTLPSTIDAGKVEASFEDGVLRIALPKSEMARSREIKISEGKGGLFSKLLGQKQKQGEKEVKGTETKAS